MPLPIAPDSLWLEVEGSLAVSADLDPKDYPDWERLLTPENDPRTWLHRERQRINDCQANAATTGNEVLERRLKGKSGEQARMFVYQWSEVADGRLGGDAGSSIQSGIKVLTNQGAPLETEYPYSQYTRSRRQLDGWTTEAVRQSAAGRKIAGAAVAPSFAAARVHGALGNPIHWGTFWGLSFRTETIASGVTARVCRRYRRAHGDAGHATEVVWPIKTPAGEWLLAVANSHDDGFFYVSEEAYEEMRDRTYTPYGAYVLLGHQEPHRQYEGQFSAMGW